MHFNVLRRQAHLEIFRIYRLHKAGHHLRPQPNHANRDPPVAPSAGDIFLSLRCRAWLHPFAGSHHQKSTNGRRHPSMGQLPSWHPRLLGGPPGPSPSSSRRLFQLCCLLPSARVGLTAGSTSSLGTARPIPGWKADQDPSKGRRAAPLTTRTSHPAHWSCAWLE